VTAIYTVTSPADFNYVYAQLNTFMYFFF